MEPKYNVYLQFKLLKKHKNIHIAKSDFSPTNSTNNKSAYFIIDNKEEKGWWYKLALSTKEKIFKNKIIYNINSNLYKKIYILEIIILI